MDVQDYEYYEARAKDVKLEDITSSQLNADILERLRDNDPELTKMYINITREDFDDFVVCEGDNLGWLGYFVGRSIQLEGLSIDNFPDNLNIDAFLRGLGHNRSIESLCICTDIGEGFKSLGPLLRNNNSISDLTFSGFNIGLQCARNIATLLGQQSSLKCLSFEDIDLYDEGLMEIAVALRTKPQIEELGLLGNQNIGRNGCVALGSALEGMRNPDLAMLNLDYNGIDDEGLHALVAGLINCRNLTSLYLSGNEFITEAGLRSLRTLFQSEHCRLEHLDLNLASIDNDGAVALATGLVSLPTLKKLELSGTSIGDQGLQALVGSLVNCNVLEELNLSQNLFPGLGLRSLGVLVQRTMMKELCLRNNAINDEGLQCLVEGMIARCSLTHLDLSYNDSITAAGLRTLSAFFQSDNCCLRDLWLRGINFGDEGAVALANGLIGNESLIDLKFNSSDITARGWSAFSKLLCDTSCINNTYLSNHTLVAFGGYTTTGGGGGYGTYVTPSDIVGYLWLNKWGKRAAMSKILDSHPDIDVEPLFQWKLKCLPLVVKWLENAKPYLFRVNANVPTEEFQYRQLSAVFKFVRGSPQLAVDGYRGKKMKNIQTMSKKRKFDQTL
ncbi:leucine-rich repeat protein [Skeletonema marinoi]|uniref:Leucine-rich repeat protein n=1 Tax=Skeletonema marinoi TaxID=267567 RepID=A0AAD8XVT1_9STRA|nr:leucine-rich repeat protein [Skeletonema marinoi]